MDSIDIIQHIRNFFNNATPEQLKEIHDAASIELEEDITVEEYLENFNDQYFYS